MLQKLHRTHKMLTGIDFQAVIEQKIGHTLLVLVHQKGSNFAP